MKARGLLLRLIVLLLVASSVLAQGGGELRFCLRAEPKTFNPLLVAEDASETIRYMTGGVLVRINRSTQQLEPALAVKWQTSKDGRSITFILREHIAFSDGTPFSAPDVAFTVRQMMDPNLHSPTADAFRAGAGQVDAVVLGPNRVRITFPVAIANLPRLFDQAAIMSASSPQKEMAVLGPFYVGEHKPGSYVLLKRNPNYWRRDERGRQLPYLESVRLEIQPNRDIEALRFRRGEIHLINSIDTEYYERLAQSSPSSVRDAGASLDTEQLWFNQVPTAPLAAYKLAWFQSQDFRRAVSQAINRADLARVVFGAHAQPAFGPVSPADKLWFNTKLPAPVYDRQAALARLQRAGFALQGGVLKDRDGHAVEFSIISNSGNKYRERMAVMIQQDLAQLGMKVRVVTLDFPSLIERIAQSFDYEACLLGLVNVDSEPNQQMNLWLSSGENHQWNPHQKSPATAWEAEIDRLMKAQASSLDYRKRKAYFDRVQEIVIEQAPFIYLVNKNALAAVSPALAGASPVPLRPQTFWNIDTLALKSEVARNRP